MTDLRAALRDAASDAPLDDHDLRTVMHAKIGGGPCQPDERDSFPRGHRSRATDVRHQRGYPRVRPVAHLLRGRVNARDGGRGNFRIVPQGIGHRRNREPAGPGDLPNRDMRGFAGHW